MLIGIANATKLRDDTISSLLSVALVSRRIYMIAMPLIYKSIRIDISGYTYSSSHTDGRQCIERPVSTLVVRLSAGPSVRAMVRSTDVFSRTAIHPETLARLQSMVPSLSQLESLSWDVDGSFPAAFLEPLRQRWPKSHLHIRTDFYDCNIAKDWISRKLAPHMLCFLQVPSSPSMEKRGRNQAALCPCQNGRCKSVKSKVGDCGICLLWNRRLGARVSCMGARSFTQHDGRQFDFTLEMQVSQVAIILWEWGSIEIRAAVTAKHH